MKTLLRIDCSLRQLNSYSRTAGDHFVTGWKNQNPDHEIIFRDLEKNPVPHLSQQVLNIFFGMDKKPADLSDELINELINADEILITCPMYNFGIPSSLKAYFDQIIRNNKTFSFQNEPKGLLRNKKAFLICAIGGSQEDAIFSMETQLKNSLSYIGISDLIFFKLYNTANEATADQALTEFYERLEHQINTYE